MLIFCGFFFPHPQLLPLQSQSSIALGLLCLTLTQIMITVLKIGHCFTCPLYFRNALLQLTKFRINFVGPE